MVYASATVHVISENVFVNVCARTHGCYESTSLNCLLLQTAQPVEHTFPLIVSNTP